MSDETYIYDLSRWMGRALALMFIGLGALWVWSAPWYVMLGILVLICVLCVSFAVFIAAMISMAEEVE